MIEIADALYCSYLCHAHDVIYELLERKHYASPK